MITIDANLLIYATVAVLPQHRSGKAWIERTLATDAPVRLSWGTLLAYLRLSTNPRIFRAPLSMEQAVSFVTTLLEFPNVSLLEAGPRHWLILSNLLQKGQARAELVSDAHLAALAIENGATLCTNDRDFSRFPGLRVEYPLQ
jgi:toxin-antitoxin system PIN domain toxin